MTICNDCYYTSGLFYFFELDRWGISNIYLEIDMILFDNFLLITFVKDK